jgi:hypothetical protein
VLQPWLFYDRWLIVADLLGLPAALAVPRPRRLRAALAIVTLLASNPAAWGISLAGNGTLLTDDYSTTLTPTTTPSPSPTTSTTASPGPTASASPSPTGSASQGQWTVLGYQVPIRAVHATLLKNERCCCWRVRATTSASSRRARSGRPSGIR